VEHLPLYDSVSENSALRKNPDRIGTDEIGEERRRSPDEERGWQCVSEDFQQLCTPH